MKQLSHFMVGLLAWLLLAGVGRATGAELVLKGRVVDENGLPVSTAHVKLELSGGQSYSAVSDDAGYFSIASLSAGEYTVRIEKPGFFVLADQRIQLSADSTEFVFALNHEEEVREKVDVKAPEHRIEPSSTTGRATLTSSEILDIPVPNTHNLLESLVAIPQVVQDNATLIHIAGARNTQAQYLIDGVEVGDPASNGLSARMVVEAVRSTEIQTGRFGAEYAHPGAAVLSYETREGDDRWRFGATDFLPAINVQQGVQLGNYYPRAFISGPILKDRVWFSQAFDVLHTLSIVKGLPAGQNEVREWGGDSWSRLLWKISANHSLHVSLLANLESDSNLGLDALHPQTTTTDASENQWFGSVKEQSYVHQALVELGGGIERTIGGWTPQGPPPYILLVNNTAGGYFQQSRDRAHRYQAFAQVIRAPPHELGKHMVSAGANVSGVDLFQTATRGAIQVLRGDQTLARLTTFAGSPTFRVANTLAGGFAQDSWSPNPHLVAQIGVRADWDRLFQAALVQPRLAMNWLPFSDNHGKLSVGWGRYDIPLNLSVIGQVYDQREVDTLYDPTGTTPIQGPATSQFVLPPGGLTQLQQPYCNIASAAYQQQVGEKTLISVEFLARDQRHGLAYETLSPGVIGSELLLQTSRRDKYRGVTVVARHTFRNSGVLFGSYTRARSSSDQVLDPVLGMLSFAPQQAGPLLWDAPNRFLSWGSVLTPVWGIRFSYLFDYRTGYPYSAINQQQFLVGAPNTLRFPDFASLTIGLEKRFTFRNRVFAGRVAVINTLNRQNPNVVVNNIAAPNFGTFAGGQGLAITGRLRFVGRK